LLKCCKGFEPLQMSQHQHCWPGKSGYCATLHYAQTVFRDSQPIMLRHACGVSPSIFICCGAGVAYLLGAAGGIPGGNKLVRSIPRLVMYHAAYFKHWTAGLQGSRYDLPPVYTKSCKHSQKTQ
jgi:hypothetical protein